MPVRGLSDYREPGVRIAQASHGGRSIATQGRCDLVAKSCPLTIPLLLINRRHLNTLDDWPPAKSSSPLRQPQHLARPSSRIPRRALPFCITSGIAPVSLQVTTRDPRLECQWVSWKQTDRRPVALWDCPDHISEYANAGQPIRLFGCRQAQGTSTELVEVGDLSCRKINPDKAGVSLF
jgi:hypothetical protein